MEVKEDLILKYIAPCVVDGKLTYKYFDQFFSTFSQKEQYAIYPRIAMEVLWAKLELS